MSDSDRIEQFKQMVHADPNNELGHFSLGRAYLEAGELAHAITSLQHAIGLNPNLGRAYHLLGEAQLRTGARTDAIQTLTQGAKVAAARGEALTRQEIVKLLEELNAPVPPEALSAAKPAGPVGEGEVLCRRCGRLGRKLPRPPFRNPQGQLIFENICADCWREWIGMGTKVINELRLPMNEPEAQKVYDRHMHEFLNLPGLDK